MLFSCLFQSFEEKEYQKESKRNETFARIIFGTDAIQETWSGSQGSNEAATRQEGAPPPSWAPRSSTDLLLSPIYILLYPENIQESHETTFPPPQPSVPMRSHLGAFFGVLPGGDSITEGFYIKTIASLMKRE